MIKKNSNAMSPEKAKIFLLYNPKGVVDKDIYLSAKESDFHTEERAFRFDRMAVFFDDLAVRRPFAGTRNLLKVLSIDNDVDW